MFKKKTIRPLKHRKVKCNLPKVTQLVLEAGFSHHICLTLEPTSPQLCVAILHI